ncbi:MAG: ferritin [Anaerovoracaceae bacterium]|jgi:ferritin
MLSNMMKELINTQINQEFYSAYLYLAFSNYYYGRGLDGFAHWFDVQAHEEIDHAALFRAYLCSQDAAVEFDAIGRPNVDLKDPIDPLRAALSHEQGITSMIDDIYSAADGEHDYRTMEFLRWFIREQNEEEQNAADLVRKFNLYGSDPRGLYMLNEELRARTYSAPSLEL